jgi:hypothetical protein
LLPRPSATTEGRSAGLAGSRSNRRRQPVRAGPTATSRRW